MAGTHVEVPADVRAAFDREYEAYMHAPDGTGYTGGTTALQQQHLDSIARLGPRALPLVMETLRETGDSNLAAVAGRMSKKHFVLSELPDGKPPDQHGWVALCLRWWDREHARTPQRFAELYEVWKQTKRQWMVLGSYELVYDDSFKGIWYSRRAQTKDGELLDEIKALGIAALPFMMEKIKEGDYDMLPVIAQLTDGGAADAEPLADQPLEERARRCLEWWEKNKEQWTIPFPDAGEAAAPAAAPPAPKAIEPARPAGQAPGAVTDEARKAAIEQAKEKGRKPAEEARRKAAEAEAHAQPAAPGEGGPAE
jgi:hypothetical protein